MRVPGERQDYFRATMGGPAMSQFLRTRIQLSPQRVGLLSRGEQLAKGEDASVRRQLEDVREFYEFVEQEQNLILDRW